MTKLRMMHNNFQAQAPSLVGSPPSAPSLLAQAEAEQEAEWIIKFDELELGRRIGAGSYGEVQRAQWRHTDVAVKRMTNCTESHMEVQPPISDLL